MEIKLYFAHFSKKNTGVSRGSPDDFQRDIIAEPHGILPILDKITQPLYLSHQKIIQKKLI